MRAWLTYDHPDHCPNCSTLLENTMKTENLDEKMHLHGCNECGFSWAEYSSGEADGTDA